jgi:hypothetical protein
MLLAQEADGFGLVDVAGGHGLRWWIRLPQDVELAQVLVEAERTKGVVAGDPMLLGRRDFTEGVKAQHQTRQRRGGSVAGGGVQFGVEAGRDPVVECAVRAGGLDGGVDQTGLLGVVANEVAPDPVQSGSGRATGTRNVEPGEVDRAALLVVFAYPPQHYLGLVGVAEAEGEANVGEVV